MKRKILSLEENCYLFVDYNKIKETLHYNVIKCNYHNFLKEMHKKKYKKILENLDFINNNVLILDITEIDFVDNYTVLDMYFYYDDLYHIKFCVKQEVIDEMFGSLINYFSNLNDVVNYIFVNYLFDSNQRETINDFCYMNNVADALAYHFTINIKKIDKGYMFRNIHKFKKYNEKIKTVNNKFFKDIILFYINK